MIILAKLLLGVAGAIAAVILTSSRRVQALSNARFGALAVGLGVASRLALFTLVYVVLRYEVHSDLPSFYYPQAERVLHGELVYRDFSSSYAPLFPYLAAGAVALWHTPKSLVLLAIALEALSLPLWLRTARAAFDEATARRAMVLFLTSAPPLLNVALEGQNQTYCAFLLAASFALLVARRPFLSGLVAGAATAVVKFIAAVGAAGPLFGAADRRARWLAGGAMVPALVYGGFALAGADVLMPVRLEAGQRSSGNLPFLLTALGAGPAGGAWSAVAIAGVALALAAVLIAVLRSGAEPGPRSALYVTTLVLLTLMLVSKKAYTSYLTLGFFPIAATVAARAPGRRGVLAFGLFGAVAACEPTMWFHWLQPADFRVLWQPTAAGAARGPVVVLLLWDLALVGGYIALWRQAFRSLIADRRDAAVADTGL